MLTLLNKINKSLTDDEDYVPLTEDSVYNGINIVSVTAILFCALVLLWSQDYALFFALLATSLIFKLSGRYAFGMGLFTLIGVMLSVAIKNEPLANTLAINLYFLLVCGVLIEFFWMAVESFQNRDINTDKAGNPIANYFAFTYKKLKKIFLKIWKLTPFAKYKVRIIIEKR
jgi:hypothetical protein